MLERCQTLTYSNYVAFIARMIDTGGLTELLTQLQQGTAFLTTKIISC